MKLLKSEQKWKGHFTYLVGYETIDQYKEVTFSMDIIVNNDSFNGISTDSESSDAFDKPAKVKGFFEKDSISFILKYPCSYYKNEEDEIVLDKTSKHPDIHYFGYLDSTKREANGKWEMTLSQEEYGEDYIDEVVSGEFQMRRIN